MISLKRLLEDEQLQMNFDSEPAPESNDLVDTTQADEYINAVKSHLSKNGSDREWKSGKYDLEVFLRDKFNKASDEIKQILINDIGSVTTNAEDVTKLPADLASNIYFSDRELRAWPRHNNDNEFANADGAGEFAFAVAHQRAQWVGGNATGDILLDGHSIDLKDETKLKEKVSAGLDLRNKLPKGSFQGKFFFHPGPIVKFQKKLLKYHQLIEILNSSKYINQIFISDEAKSEFNQLVSDLHKMMYAGKGDKPDPDVWLPKWLDARAELNVVKDIDVLNPRQLLRLVKLGSKLKHTLEVQCYIDNLNNFLSVHSNDIDTSNKLGRTLLQILKEPELTTPNYYAKLFKQSFNLEIDGISNSLGYDYILVVDKTSSAPNLVYFPATKDNLFPLGMHGQDSWDNIKNPGMLLAPADFIKSVTTQPSIEDLTKGACAGKNYSRSSYKYARFMHDLTND
jgi:hypothetical protein